MSAQQFELAILNQIKLTVKTGLFGKRHLEHKLKPYGTDPSTKDTVFQYSYTTSVNKNTRFKKK